MNIRQYKNYGDYLKHQSSKLSKEMKGIIKKDYEVECTVFDRYREEDFVNKFVLCLGARIGGEVRAFKRLGAKAIGIDLNPGEDNEYVIKGDFHKLEFIDNSFDILFTNSIDHVLLFDEFFSEARRVLKKKGVFICELKRQRMGRYETLNTLRDVEWLFVIIRRYFNVKKQLNIKDCDILWLN